MLEHLVPFTGIFFAYTNTVGAALWTHDVEQDKTNRMQQQLLSQLQDSRRISEIEVQDT
jgi:hypothetical protein